MLRKSQLIRKTIGLFGSPRKSTFLLLLVLIFVMAATVVAQEGDDGGDTAEPEWVVISEEVLPFGTQSTARIIASQDAYLSSLNANSNYGGATTMGLGYWSGVYNAMRPLIQFNVSGVPAQATIDNATMYIYQQSSSPTNDGQMGFKAQYMKQGWNEYSVTWNNANYLGGDEISIGQNTSALGWKSSDVTSLVRAWHNGSRPNYGFLITGDEGPQNNRNRFFRSRQWGGYEPYLIVNYTQCSDLTPPTATVNPLPAWSKTSFNVSWTGSDSGAGIAYYNIQYNRNGGSWTNWLSQTTATSATFNGAADGQQYQFRAQAADNCGNVGAWTGAQAFTNIDSVAPSASVAALPPYTFASSFIVNWSGTDNPGGSGIKTYDIQVRVNGGSWQNWLTGTSSTSGQITGAAQGNVYEFQARATDNAGNVGSYPNHPQASTTVVLYSVAVVRPFSPYITDQTSFNVSWIGYHAPGVTIVTYDVRYRFNNGPWTNWVSTGNTSAPFTAVDPNVDGIYEFEARAIDSHNQTEPWTGVPEAAMIVDRHAPYIEKALYFPMIILSQ